MKHSLIFLSVALWYSTLMTGHHPMQHKCFGHPLFKHIINLNNLLQQQRCPPHAKANLITNLNNQADEIRSDTSRYNSLNTSCIICGNKLLHFLFSLPNIPAYYIWQVTKAITRAGRYNILLKNYTHEASSLEAALQWALKQPKRYNGLPEVSVIYTLETLQEAYPDHNDRVQVAIDKLQNRGSGNDTARKQLARCATENSTLYGPHSD